MYVCVEALRRSHDDQHKGGALFALWRVLFCLASNTNGLPQPKVEPHVSNRATTSQRLWIRRAELCLITGCGLRALR